MENPFFWAFCANVEFTTSNSLLEITLYTNIVSICCMGLGITPLNIGEMSYAAISGITTKFQEKEKYELDI